MIIEYENTLRRLILQIIGEEEAKYKVTEERIKKWNEKRDIEFKKGLLTEKRLIYFSDFYDLKTIIDKNWDKFVPILKDKKRFDVFFSEIETFRNTLAHGRTLTSSQELLLKGIVPDLKNCITIYHNKNNMTDDFFVEIIKVSDNLGNVWTSNGERIKPTLRVGDEYELIIEANDPKGRRLGYQILSRGAELNLKQDSNRFNIKIDNSLVGKYMNFVVIVFTPESEYANESSFVLNYTILPKD